MKVAGNWQKFGLQLDVEPYILDAVKAPHGSNEYHCRCMLEYWLDGKPGTGERPRTWSTVLEAVASSCGSLVRRDITEALNL